jgi:HAE1 family hydrophobic/amphiphilic exporter-1
VVGGLVASQALTLFVTPVIYLYMEWLSGWLLGLGGRKASAAPADVQPSLFDEGAPKAAAR